jgi:hypothetical protein
MHGKQQSCTVASHLEKMSQRFASYQQFLHCLNSAAINRDPCLQLHSCANNQSARNLQVWSGSKCDLAASCECHHFGGGWGLIKP